ncbi:MAG: trimethylamine methyltransferase, partial [Actinobacteria bacterium]|nr:trimethylamine methyltransferase [Actinomycetota bacterium]
MRLRLSALEPGEAERIVDRALEILAGTGMRMEGTRALADLARAGAHVEGSGLV